MRVLVTRVAEDAARTAQNLRAAGHEPVIAPLRVMEPVVQATVPDGAFTGVLATSRHAFSAPPLPESLRALPCHCVGRATAQRAVQAGHALASACGASVEDMAAQLIRLSDDARWLYLAGSPRKPVLEERLGAAGHTVVVLERYHMAVVPTLPVGVQVALRQGDLDVVLHYSAQSAAAFWSLVRAAGLEAQAFALDHLCLSQAVADAAPAGARCRVAASPTEASLIQLLP